MVGEIILVLVITWIVNDLKKKNFNFANRMNIARKNPGIEAL